MDIVLICSKQNEQMRKREENAKMQKEFKKKQELEKAKLEEEKKKVCTFDYLVIFKFIYMYYI